jgi:hypothetical protein
VIKLYIFIFILFFYQIGAIFIEVPLAIEIYASENSCEKSLNYAYYRGFLTAYFL